MKPSPSLFRTILIIGLLAGTGIFAGSAAASAFDLPNFISATFGTAMTPSAEDVRTSKGKASQDSNRTEAVQFSQGFEVNNSWDTTGTITDPTRVASGTNGITSKTGGFHAEVATQATDWGGYNSTFPALGYVTQLDIYLDPNGGYLNDRRWDFSSAISQPDGNHRRDFVFNCGFYNDVPGPGSGNRFICSASNNGTGWPKDPLRGPTVITNTPGWFTFKHHFYNNGSGILAVDLSVIDSSGAIIGSWTLSDPTDVIGSTVGGNRYGWMVRNQLPFLAVDNAYRASVAAPAYQVVTQASLTATPNLTQWFFYQDTSPEGINNTLGSFVKGPGTPPSGVGSAQISTSGLSRPNLATYQFSGTPLASINELKFSTYNPSAGNPGSPNRSGYLHFNVDFNGTDTWQRRLVYVPSANGTVVQDSWQEWDAYNNGSALWSYSGGTWPAGIGEPGTTPGTTAKSWSTILSTYPGVRIRVTDSFLGIRVGEPYSDGYTENIDKFVFGTASATTVFDFEPEAVVVDLDGQGSVTDCGASDLAYSTIQSAVTAVVPGTKILVCPGTYNESPQIAKSLTLQSTGGRNVTTIQLLPSGSPGTGYLAGVYINSATANVTIDGFTIIGNDAANPVLANSNVVIQTASSVTVTNSRLKVGAIDGGSNGDDGIGLVTTFGSGAGPVTVTNNEIMPVNASGARAFYINPGTGTTFSFQNNQVTGHFTRNSATECGGPISNNTFTGTGASGGFGAYNFAGPACGDPGPFTNNKVSGATTGILIYDANNTVLTGNTFTGNDTGILIDVEDVTGTVAHYNRIANNTTAGFTNNTASVVDAENNWWGCNYGPGASGADCPVAANGITGIGAASVDADPWLTLTSSATPGSVLTGGSSTVSGKLTINNLSADTSGGGNVPNGTPASYAAVLGTVTPNPTTSSAGLFSTAYTAGGTQGTGSVATTVDGQTVSNTIYIYDILCPDVSMQHVTSLTNVPITIPVNTTLVTGREITSAQFKVTFNPAIINPAGITITPGTVVGVGTLITYNYLGGGVVSVSVADPNPWVGAGSIVNINANVIGNIGDVSPLTFSDLKLYKINPIAEHCLATPGGVNGSVTIISGTITGNVNYKLDLDDPLSSTINKPVDLAVITASGTPSPIPGPTPAVTDILGNYSMNGFGPGSYLIAASKAPKLCGTPTNGINSNDAAEIAKWVVNLRTFSLDQKEAAGVSGLPGPNSLDASLIARFIVCSPTAGNLTGNWVFKPLFNPLLPVNTIAGGVYNYNALLMGDVTGDWATGSALRAAPVKSKNAVRASVPAMEGRPGSVVTIPLSLANLKADDEITSYQFDIEYDPTVLRPEEVAAVLEGTSGESLQIVSNSPTPGLLKVVVFGIYPVSGDGIFANLRFTVNGRSGMTTPLSVKGFRFNDNSRAVVGVDGKLTVTVAASDTKPGRQ